MRGQSRDTHWCMMVFSCTDLQGVHRHGESVIRTERAANRGSGDYDIIISVAVTIPTSALRHDEGK